MLRLIREVLAFEPKSRGTDIPQALQFLSRVQRKKSVVFLLSDLIDEGWEDAVKIANRKHDLVTICVGDPREEDLPPIGLIHFEDAETGETKIIDTSDARTRKFLKTWSIERRELLTKTLRRLSVDHLEVTTGQDYIPPLVRLFERRAKSY